MAAKWEIVKLAQKGCKFCGSKTVHWFEGDTGKWYLGEVFEIDGELRAAPTLFHSAFCTAKGKTPKLDHADEQRKYAQRDQDDADERESLRKAQEDRESEESATMFLNYIAMSMDEKLAAISLLERAMDSFKRNPPTLDYMTEFQREVEAQQKRQTEWRFLKALVGDPQENGYSSL
jgi:hypothetical protein